MEIFTILSAGLMILWTLQNHGVSAVPHSGAAGVDCTLDDDQTNPALDRCLDLGQQFAEKYEKYLKKGKKMDVCVEYTEFGDCLRPMLQTCLTLNTTIDKKWKTILNQIDCLCSKNKNGCSVDLVCLESEQGSIYTDLCQALYEFNIKQGTHGKCRFLRERVDCEQSLVASACGEPTGDFYHAMVKARSKKEKCFVPHSSPKIQHFAYSEKCPKNLTLMFSECVSLHPSDTILSFMESNDLVVDGKRKALKVSCKHFEKYNQCMQKLATQCDLGIEKLLEYNGQMRSYQLKMEYICTEHRKDYLESMYCYQDIMKNGSFGKCTQAWDDVYSKLENVTSYQFYCLPKHSATQALTSELDKLRMCYEGVVNSACQSTAGATLGNLIHLAFQDPHYLRFEYKADCTLHNTDPPQPETVSTPLSTPTPATMRLSTSSHQRRSHSNRHNTVKDNQPLESPEAKASVTGSSASALRGLSWTCLLSWVLVWTTNVGLSQFRIAL